ncbi:MFS transporter [Flavobacterium sp. UBA7682]|uniref:MFS transporter n=1 Tax=Flavobacterium sp. UBA7682 TaxID=1946560 RepID=UPI0025BF1E4E|nr:MFS transporter [Flavobacterium sp. UBA7682]
MKKVLVLLVFSQFVCASIWFASNAVMADIVQSFQLTSGSLAYLTSSVQFGFVGGTFVFAFFSLADRYSPSLVFFLSALVGSCFNLCILFEGNGISELLLFRFGTGFFLAGIYPVGMKIAADYYQQSLGKSLGFLVGALVLGTAFPHFLKSVTFTFDWKYVIIITSGLAIFGGLLVYFFVSVGPYRKPFQKVVGSTLLSGFKDREFRVVAFGYFGHMWELYTFWAFVPVMLTAYNSYYTNASLNVPFFSFLVIAVGGIGCVLSGLFSHYFGVKRVAMVSLLFSCLCCLFSPLFLLHPSAVVFILFMLFWGFFVIADSPLFSTLVAQLAPEATKGTSLTFVTSLGFAITIVSIQILNELTAIVDSRFVYMVLGIGPILGLVAMLKKNPLSA